MNLLILSDLHLEFSLLDIDITGVDIIVLAGDIHLGTRGIPWIGAQSKGLPVIYVPGNHEFYKGEHSRVLRDLRAACGVRGDVERSPARHGQDHDPGRGVSRCDTLDGFRAVSRHRAECTFGGKLCRAGHERLHRLYPL